MKFHLSALFLVIGVPAILAGNVNRSSLRGIVREALHQGHEPSPHIINGVEAPRNGFPHQVLLNINIRPGVGTLCAGSLIHPEWVLTAAHCVKGSQEIGAVLGAHNLDDRQESSRQSIKVSQHFLGPTYDKDETDIALLKLEKPAQINKFVQTIALPTRSFRGRNFDGTEAQVSGWGRFINPNGGLSSVLRFAQAKIISNDACKRAGFGDGIKNWRICTERTAGKGPCGGDSGGPMFITEKDGKRTILGVVSFGTPECEAPAPSVYTRVDHFLDWIHTVTRIPIQN